MPFARLASKCFAFVDCLHFIAGSKIVVGSKGHSSVTIGIVQMLRFVHELGFAFPTVPNATHSTSASGMRLRGTITVGIYAHVGAVGVFANSIGNGRRSRVNLLVVFVGSGSWDQESSHDFRCCFRLLLCFSIVDFVRETRSRESEQFG